ncbi:MAG TPA: 3'-5' exonuclease [Flavobacterium sp.]|nr:3'-5' exonuclease [Flavobacterium sp.]
MLDWLKINKEYPEFWKSYLRKFDHKPNRFVALSTETTGLDPENDALISIGAVALENDKIIVKDSFYISIYQENPEIAVKSGILNSDGQKISEPEAISAFIGYLGNAILVGHRIHFDIEMINRALDRMQVGKLRNEALDIEVMYQKWKQLLEDRQFTLAELAASFKMQNNERHTASDDAYTISLLFLRLKHRLKL